MEAALRWRKLGHTIGNDENNSHNDDAPKTHGAGYDEPLPHTIPFAIGRPITLHRKGQLLALAGERRFVPATVRLRNRSAIMVE